ncbi:anthranilate phosphoribosyltransferase [Granulosicoccus antarcticus]|uniref:Anthranilate phosphoribosyltransferase n=1 Tax=Granulosicoccus antarcticus IMCC3135 TaxID=1192854 RepID=A0A2Z2NNK9_9GAMM|nr:anthranilate phosphoribosyltransferase [Granulosicoccus antarcticus]ASJ71521.1 Anthranilate phosphoribosyltransferase [Granulosicoccus antarcticus IMCC3135]
MTDDEFMRDVLQRIATGPTLSKDISAEHAQRAMRIILEGKADEVQAGIFLIALRMKRETDDELVGILDAINAGITPLRVEVDDLLTIVDPYDGYLRGVPVAPFLPAALAACGLRVLTHGLDSMGPKFGASHEAVLRAAGHKVGVSRETAAVQLEDDNCGWAYLSQLQLAPELAALTSLRTRIVKRPCLTTIEVAVNSLVPRVSSHLVTGFVHKPYPPIYAMLAAKAGFAGSIMIRGVEGGVVPSLAQPSRYFHSDDGVNLTQVDLEPTALGIASAERAVPLPAHLLDDSIRSVKAPGNQFAKELADCAAKAGLAALSGQAGPARDSLVYTGAVILQARGLADSLPEAAGLLREVLDNGEAERRFRHLAA